MSNVKHFNLAFFVAVGASSLSLGSWVQAQRAEPDNGRPNPYRAVEAWATLRY